MLTTSCKIRKKSGNSNDYSEKIANFAVKFKNTIKMAKKKTARKTTKSSFSDAIGLNYIFDNTITDFFLGLLLLAIAVVMIIAMASYLSTGAEDQSLLEDLRPGEWLNSKQEFRNYCGSLGAIVSYYLITVNFGIPAIIIPFFFILCGFHLMRVYNVSLLKWFFGMTVVMIWCSVTFAKFMAPFTGFMVFNPGGKHGQYIVQVLENVVGSPGLTALLLIVAVAFLTYLSSETINVVRKALNPIGYISNKVKFEITNHNRTDKSQLAEEAITETGTDEKAGYKDPEVSEAIDLTHMGENAEKDVAEGKPTEERKNDADEDAISSQKIGMDITVGAEDQRASGNTAVASDDALNTPINPKEPFTRYKYPTLDLLKKYANDGKPYIDEAEQIENKNRIIEVLGNFGVTIKTIRATVGPTITLYEIQPAEGVRISKIKNLEDDIALSLAALGIRIIAPIPGKGTIGIEVPNAKANIVSMESILNSKKFQETKMDLPIALGKTITNEVFMVDLAKIPHLLVAGATGQGKSVGLNAIITSLLYKKHPNELKLVLIDPKKVEFSIYAPIANHFMAAVADEEEPIITDVSKVVRTLNSLCALMDRRYDLLKMAGARNIKEYNLKYVNHRLDPTKGHEYMPYIVVIIDEFGDLIMTAGKEIELPIARIAQLARAVGIHMIIATQRPTTTIITGNIKANFPGRIAFKVSAGIDSKTILDRSGAQQLIGRGDMLYLNGNEPVRVQCAFVDTPEVEQITAYVADQPGPIEPMELPEPATEDGAGGAGGSGLDAHSLDPYFEEAAHAVVISQQGSTSMIQRRFSIGYNRAGRLMDQLESAGIVGAAQGSKPREVLIQDENQLNTLIASLRGIS